MNRLLSCVAVVACAAVALAVLHGCGARTEVAKDKVLKKIDNLLGETEVQKKEVELAIKNMDRAIDELTKGRITATVKAERASAQLAETEGKIADAKGSLGKLRGYLDVATEVEIGGKTYTHEQVRAMADKVVQAHKALSAQAETLKGTRDRLNTIAATLKTREDEARDKQARLKSQLREIETELVALNTYKDAAAAAGDAEVTFADNFAELEKKVNNLQDRVKAEVRLEDEKWKVTDAKKDLESAEAIISATKGSSDTISEIDKILGNK
jgi:chromosome segregation ATPase